MIFYLLLLLSSMALIFLSQYAGKRLGLFSCAFVTVVLGAVASLRGYVGTDTYSYHLHFELIKSTEGFGAVALGIEPGFVLIGKLISFAGGDSFAYISFIGVLQTLLVLFIIRRIERPHLFLFFYTATFYLSFHFNILRASTSLLLILVALLWIKEGGFRFYFVLFLSVLFHYVAALIVFYVLLYKECKEKRYIAGATVLLVGAAAVYGAMSVFENVVVKYGMYLQGDFVMERDFGIGLLLQIILYLGLGLTLLKQGVPDFIFFALSLAALKYLAVDYPIMGRLESYVLPMLMLVLTRDAATGWRRHVSGAIIVALGMLNVYGVLSGLYAESGGVFDPVHSASPYIPYHTVWGIE